MEQENYVVSSPACVSIPVSDVDALLACGSMDCIRMYLYLRRWDKPRDEQRISEDLHLSLPAVREAGKQLRRMGLLGGPAAPAAPAEELPQYDALYIADRTRADARFRDLVQEAGQIMGRKLSTTELQTLFGMYDSLGLPPEVIVMMMNACKEEWAEKYGPGRVPTMRQMEKEAYVWARLEIFTLEQAETHLVRRQEKRDRVQSLKRALGIRDRELSATERKYLEGWTDLGFSPEAVMIAYDRTVTQTGGLKWPYMNKILQSWHQKGLHTPSEIEAGDAFVRKGKKTPDPQSAAPAAGEKERLMKMLDTIRK